MATRPVEGEPGWYTPYNEYEDISHNENGTLRLIGSEADGQAVPVTTGFQFIAVGGVSTKVYTKYITDVIGAGTSTDFAHGITDFDDILSITVSLYNGVSSYNAAGYRDSGSSTFGTAYGYDATNVVVEHGTSIPNGAKIRIKIDYIL